MRKRNAIQKLMFAFALTLMMGWSAWKVPAVRQAFIRVIVPPVSIIPPTLSSPRSISPENLQAVQLTEHWGNGQFRSMAWSADERYFGIGTTLGVNLYDGNSLTLLKYLELPVGGVDSLVFSPDNSLLAVASDGHSIAVYDLDAGRVVNQWPTQGWISALAFARDDTLVAVTFPYGSAFQIRVLKEVNGNLDTVALRGAATNQLFSARFDEASQMFVLELTETIDLVDPFTGETQTLPASSLTRDVYLPSDAVWLEPRDDGLSLAVHSNGVLLNTISFEDYYNQTLVSPNGRAFAILDLATDKDSVGSLTIWNVPVVRQTRAINIPDIAEYVEDNSPDGKKYMQFSPSGERLALWTSSAVVKIFAVVENEISDAVITDPYAGLADIGITPTGQIRGARCTGNTVAVVELPGVNSLAQWQFTQPTCAQLTNDGSIVSINKEYNRRLLYNVDKTTAPAAIKTICCQVFSANGKVGAGSSGTNSGEPVPVWIWSQGFGSHLWQFPDSGRGASSLAVAPSGQYVAAVVGERTYLWIHGIETGLYFPAFTRWPKVVFSPDEKYLASAEAILNLESGERIVFEGMEDIFGRMSTDQRCDPSNFSATAFSPDGQLLVAQICGVVEFWSPTSGKLLGELPDPYYSTKFIFSPDGISLIGFAPGSVTAWAIPDK